MSNFSLETIQTDGLRGVRLYPSLNKAQLKHAFNMMAPSIRSEVEKSGMPLIGKTPTGRRFNQLLLPITAGNEVEGAENLAVNLARDMQNIVEFITGREVIVSSYEPRFVKDTANQEIAA